MLGPLVGITMLLGFMSLGIGSWRANKLPRWTAVLWVIGGALIVPGFAVQEILVVIGGVIQGTAWSGLVSRFGQAQASRLGNPNHPHMPARLCQGKVVRSCGVDCLIQDRAPHGSALGRTRQSAILI